MSVKTNREAIDLLNDLIRRQRKLEGDDYVIEKLELIREFLGRDL